MEALAQKIHRTHVEPGSLAIFWLGQAGFCGLVFALGDGVVGLGNQLLTNVLFTIFYCIVSKVTDLTKLASTNSAFYKVFTIC